MILGSEGFRNLKQPKLFKSFLGFRPEASGLRAKKHHKNIRFFNDFGFEKLANIEKPKDF